MSVAEVIWLAVGLAMDSFAAAVACSIFFSGVSARRVFRVSFHFALFQGTMPVLGWFAGVSAHSHISAWDHWLAFGLLSFIGGKAIYNAVFEKNDLGGRDPTRGLSLIILSAATSIDALAAGIGLAAMEAGILRPAIIIGGVTFALAAAGMLFGERIGVRFGRRVEAAGGVILIIIGVKILFSHIMTA